MICVFRARVARQLAKLAWQYSGAIGLMSERGWSTGTSEVYLASQHQLCICLTPPDIHCALVHACIDVSLTLAEGSMTGAQ